MDSTDQIEESMDESMDETMDESMVLDGSVEKAPEAGPAPRKPTVPPGNKRGRPVKLTPGPTTMLPRNRALERVASPAQHTQELFNTNEEGESSYTEDETSGITEEGESGTEEEESEEEENQLEEDDGAADEPETEVVRPAATAAAAAQAPLPKAKSKSMGKGQKNINIDGKKKRKKAQPSAYTMYIYKVHRQLHKDLTVSNKAMEILNSFTNDMFERIATEAASLAKLNRKHTLGSHEVATATRLILGYNSLGDHAIAEGMKSLALYQRSIEKE